MSRIGGPLLIVLGLTCRNYNGYRAFHIFYVPDRGVDFLYVFSPIRPVRYKYTPLLRGRIAGLQSVQRTSTPAYCLQDCHYFYRSALRLLLTSTFISLLYA